MTRHAATRYSSEQVLQRNTTVASKVPHTVDQFCILRVRKTCSGRGFARIGRCCPWKTSVGLNRLQRGPDGLAMREITFLKQRRV
jgi:hypothetical protein